MKTEPRVMDVTGNLDGERVGMSIDESALAHIMSVLTDLYSDPEMAVIREYSTNALDSHVEAGVTRPIEVTLPTSLSPYLKIRDFGTGLDIEDIRTIYSRYGTSTKRDTNDLVGTLGLGCKSALTYTNQFTLQGIKDGTCTQVSVSRDEDGAGSMTIVATYVTEEPSGVEITIPVKSRNDFEEKANYLYQFWSAGTVLVNGKAPERLSGIQVDDDVFVVPTDKLATSVIVMGNVPYPMEDRTYGNYAIVATVEIGAVQFTPSREALQMTAKTTKVIEEIKERVKLRSRSAAERMINEAKTKVEALEVSLFAGRLFAFGGGDKLTYKGKEIPTELDSKDQEHPFIVVRRFRAGHRKSQDKVARLPISVVNKTIFLTGYANKTFSPTQRQKLEQWWEQTQTDHQGMEVENFTLVNTLPYKKWIDPKRIYDYTVVAEQKLPTNTKRQDGRPTGSYEAFVAGLTTTVQADEIDTSKPVFYYIGGDRGKAFQIVREAHPDATIVEMSSNREAKFKRNFPQAKQLREAGKEIAQAWADKLTAEELLALKMGDGDYRGRGRTGLGRLDATRIDDPELAKVVTVSKRDFKDAFAGHHKYEYLYTLPPFEYNDPCEMYPLLSNIMDTLYYSDDDATVRDHLYLYVNAAFANTTTTKETN